MLASLLLFKLGNELTRVYALLNLRVWYCMKFMDSASFWCFTGVSNHMHMVNLECLGWMIPFWMFKGIEKERKSLHSNMVEEFSLLVCLNRQNVMQWSCTERIILFDVDIVVKKNKQIDHGLAWSVLFSTVILVVTVVKSVTISPKESTYSDWSIQCRPFAYGCTLLMWADAKTSFFVHVFFSHVRFSC